MSPARLLLPLLLGLTTSVQAGLLALAWDNDIVFATDGDYTNGMRITWLSDESTSADCNTCFATRLVERLSFLPGWQTPGQMHSFAISLEQLMITPEDLTISGPQYDDTPYTGLLQLELTGLSRGEHSITGYTLGLGASGKASLAGRSQKLVHRWTGSTEPRGWDNQLPSKPIVSLSVVHAERLTHRKGQWLESEFGWGIGGEAGNWLLDAGGGLFYTFGQNLPGNILPAYSVLSSAASMPGIFDLQNFGWAFYFGVGGQISFWSQLEDEARKAGYQLEKEEAVGVGFLGASIHSHGFLFSLSLEKSTPVTKDSQKNINYGSLGMIWQF